MSLIVALVIVQFVTSTLATNITEDANKNKTKRTISNHQVHNFGENRQVLLYPDSSGSPHGGLTGFYAPVAIKPVFDSETPKQVAAQQVLYEFQQTPTNAVSNVHVNQFYQPIPQNKHEPQNNHHGYQSQDQPNGGNTGPSQFLTSSESIASPVQHSSLIRHGQNFAQVQFQPLPHPQHIQTHQYIPGRYLYLNGKIVYQPNQNSYQSPKPVNYVSYNPHSVTHKSPIPPIPAPLIRPMNYRRFHPPQPHQLQKITKPMGGPEVVEEQNEEEPTAEDDNAPVKEEEVEDAEEGGDEKASYEESDDDDHYFSKYSFDDDDEDHGKYREEDDDDDSERDSSRSVPKKHYSKKTSKPHKYSKGNNYRDIHKYSESFSTGSKYEKPSKKGKKTGKSPHKMHYKSVKYSKELNGKPRIEKIEGKQSQNVPVVHKQKIFKEKWYVTKSTDDSTSQ